MYRQENVSLRWVTNPFHEKLFDWKDFPAATELVLRRKLVLYYYFGGHYLYHQQKHRILSQNGGAFLWEVCMIQTIRPGDISHNANTLRCIFILMFCMLNSNGMIYSVFSHARDEVFQELDPRLFCPWYRKYLFRHSTTWLARWEKTKHKHPIEFPLPWCQSEK